MLCDVSETRNVIIVDVFFKSKISGYILIGSFA